jgi:hypothetical protein
MKKVKKKKKKLTTKVGHGQACPLAVACGGAFQGYRKKYTLCKKNL